MIERQKIIFIGFAFFIILFLINFASADFFDWFGKLTGHATQQGTNVTATLNGTKGVSVTTFNQTISGVTPLEANYTAITFYVVLTDADGASDVNTTSVRANFSRTGEAVRQNNSCYHIGNINATSANFSCTINMWYFDGAGAWTITAGGADLGNSTPVYDNGSSGSTTFQYAQLQAISIYPTSLTWGASLSILGVNQSSNNDPTVVNNTGNYNLPNITITGYNLHGQTNSTQFINVANLTVNNDTSANRECDSTAYSNATILSNGTDVQIKRTILSKGNNSVNDGSTGQEQLYYCIPFVPPVVSQTYSTTYAGGQWFIKIT